MAWFKVSVHQPLKLVGFFLLQGLSGPYTTVICESKISSEILKCCRSLLYTSTFCRTNFWVYLSALLLSKIKIFDYSSILSKNYDNFDRKLFSSQAIPRNGTILAVNVLSWEFQKVQYHFFGLYMSRAIWQLTVSNF